uniref:Uncharacterized protein LOC104237573 n=1 Tax=Nicotiana sylvestris TaxID=4096 RepID=A0A1U7XT26_NICSY
MEDRAMKMSLGIIDDVLVRVDMFIFPADFVILDCEVDYEVPIILGRPFLATQKVLVDVEAGELTFRVGGMTVVTNEQNELIPIGLSTDERYSGYNKILIALENQEKTTFTCPYDNFAFSRMPFGLCNALATFQR